MMMIFGRLAVSLMFEPHLEARHRRFQRPLDGFPRRRRPAFSIAMRMKNRLVLAIPELARFSDIGAYRGEFGGDRRNDAGLVGAGDGDDKIADAP